MKHDLTLSVSFFSLFVMYVVLPIGKPSMVQPSVVSLLDVNSLMHCVICSLCHLGDTVRLICQMLW